MKKQNKTTTFLEGFHKVLPDPQMKFLVNANNRYKTRKPQKVIIFFYSE